MNRYGTAFGKVLNTTLVKVVVDSRNILRFWGVVLKSRAASRLAPPRMPMHMAPQRWMCQGT